MKRFIVSVVLLLALTNVVSAEIPPQKVWDKTFGGASSDDLRDAKVTSDGGYVLVGRTCSDGCSWWLIKTDVNGTKEWDKTFFEGGSARSVQQTSDGGYILAGTRSFCDWWLIKTDVNGTEVWNRTLGGPGAYTCHPISIQQTADGGYIFAGSACSKVHKCGWKLIKTDANGIKVWDKTFGGARHALVCSVQQTDDGGYILAGTTGEFKIEYDGMLIKTGANGTKEWVKIFGGEKSDCILSVQQTSDGGYILAGSKGHGNSLKSYVWLIKTDSNGDEVWEKTFGGISHDVARSVQPTADGGYILAARADRRHKGKYGLPDTGDFWLIKTDSNGSQIWSNIFFGIGCDDARFAQETSDGGYIIAGKTSSYGAGESDFWIIKVETATDTAPATGESPEKSVPGFGVLGGIFATFVIFVLRRMQV